MKNFAIKVVWFTTIYVFAFACISQTNIPVPVAIGLYILGNFLILFMVYTVLHDKYKTSKTFEDWYGDHVIKNMGKKE
ncbi:hypothetical protein [Flavobacterium sangjuense]|uniref:Uncharacterized protein n=1 Tax=Flavobacterium sangjuense TaxID=2518177 RepID=A0A4P7PPT6_9FLAO|nr:hypothetical protein [Flavobacterium sangjuense]QBZ96671.1 hypothetical protein GS03_00148 [Flavobacterium sangjuense]